MTTEEKLKEEIEELEKQEVSENMLKVKMKIAEMIALWICAFLMFMLGVSLFIKFDIMGYFISMLKEDILLKVTGILLIICSILIFIFSVPFLEALAFFLLGKLESERRLK